MTPFSVVARNLLLPSLGQKLLCTMGQDRLVSSVGKKKCSPFYTAWMFIIAFATANPPPVAAVSNPHFHDRRIPISDLQWGIPSRSLLQVFPIKILYSFFISPICSTSHPSSIWIIQFYPVNRSNAISSFLILLCLLGLRPVMTSVMCPHTHLVPYLHKQPINVHFCYTKLSFFL